MQGRYKYKNVNPDALAGVLSAKTTTCTVIHLITVDHHWV